MSGTPARLRLVRGAPARSSLRRAAVAVDDAHRIAPGDDREHAVRLWRGLLEGRWKIVDRFESGARRCLVLRRAADDDGALTLRERQVVGFVGLGHANKFAAAALGLAESSVSTHLSAALHKLGLRNRCELVALMAALRPVR